MSKYQEGTMNLGTANSWVRSNQVRISNPYLGNAIIEFKEEQIVEQNGNIISRSGYGTGTGLSHTMTALNANTTFALRDLITNDETNVTATFADVKQHLQSLYTYLAIERDNGNISG